MLGGRKGVGVRPSGKESCKNLKGGDLGDLRWFQGWMRHSDFKLLVLSFCLA